MVTVFSVAHCVNLLLNKYNNNCCVFSARTNNNKFNGIDSFFNNSSLFYIDVILYKQIHTDLLYCTNSRRFVSRIDCVTMFCLFRSHCMEFVKNTFCVNDFECSKFDFIKTFCALFVHATNTIFIFIQSSSTLHWLISTYCIYDSFQIKDVKFTQLNFII